MSAKVSDLEIKSEITRPEPCKVSVSVEVPQKTVRERVDVTFSQIQKSAVLPGFRQGRVPLELVRKNFADIARNDFLQKMIPAAIEQISREHNLILVGETEVDALDFDFEQELKFKATFEVKPEVVLKEYRNIKVKKEKVEISPEMVQEVLESLRERSAQLIVAGHTDIKEGDYVAVEYELFHEGKPVTDGDAQNQILQVKKDALLPGFAEQLIGMKKDERKEVQVKMPADFTRQDLAGKDVIFKVLVKEIKEKKLSELNDDFAKEIGKNLTLEQLQEGIKKDLEADGKARVRKSMEEQIINYLVQEHELPLPAVLVERQIAFLMERTKQKVAQQGKTVDELGLTDEIIRAKVKPNAERHVRTFLLLEAVAKKENLIVTEEEINKEIEQVVEQTKQSVETVRDYFVKHYQQIATRMEEDKVFKFLLDNAQIEEVAAQDTPS